MVVHWGTCPHRGLVGLGWALVQLSGAGTCSQAGSGRKAEVGGPEGHRTVWDWAGRTRRQLWASGDGDGPSVGSASRRMGSKGAGLGHLSHLLKRRKGLGQLVEKENTYLRVRGGAPRAWREIMGGGARRGRS